MAGSVYEGKSRPISGTGSEIGAEENEAPAPGYEQTAEIGGLRAFTVALVWFVKYRPRVRRSEGLRAFFRLTTRLFRI